MTDNTSNGDPPFDPLCLWRGVKEIGKNLKPPRSEKEVYGLIYSGALPCFKIGGQWALRPAELLAHYKRLEAAAAEEAAAKVAARIAARQAARQSVRQEVDRALSSSPRRPGRRPA